MKKTTAYLGATVLAATGLAAFANPAPATADQHHSLAELAIAAAQAHPGATEFGPNQSLAAVGSVTDRSGATHVRLHRRYRGLDVVGGDLVVHRAANGSWKGSSQTLRDDLALGVRPTVTKKAASTKALTAKLNAHIANLKSDGGRLVVDAARTAAPRLAWEVLTTGVQADGTPSRIASYVDAKTGAVLRSEQQIETADGSGQSLYGGTVPLQLTLSGSTYQLKDPTRGNTYTTDVANGTDGGLCSLLGIGCKTGTLYTSGDNLFGNGTTTSRESAAVDAQYGTNVTWDFYKTVFGRNGIFGNGTGSYNRVHYGKNYNNAFWDGQKMTYGDGDGVNYGPLTSLDVTGHEMSHGVTENTAGLTYSGESGGLNESTSDIFGTMVEFYAANASDPGDYLIGESFDKKKHLGFRRMDNPASDGASANCWSSSVKNLDVHNSSGVGNHFFYLLSEGSGAKTLNGVAYNSPTCNGSTTTGIGRDAAAKIWYRALTVYMTSSTTYANARTATLNAARDLYGVGSAQESAVAANWSAVNVS